MKVNHQLPLLALGQQLELECWLLALVPAWLDDLVQPKQVVQVLQLLVQKQLVVPRVEALVPQL
jgi:hypothetical protein